MNFKLYFFFLLSLKAVHSHSVTIQETEMVAEESTQKEQKSPWDGVKQSLFHLCKWVDTFKARVWGAVPAPNKGVHRFNTSIGSSALDCSIRPQLPPSKPLFFWANHPWEKGVIITQQHPGHMLSQAFWRVGEDELDRVPLTRSLPVWRWSHFGSWLHISVLLEIFIVSILNMA